MFFNTTTNPDDDIITKVTNVDWNQIIDGLINWCLTDGVKIIIAFVLMFVLFKLVNFISKRIGKSLRKHNVDKTIETVVLSFFRKIAKIAIVLSLMAYLGIESSALATLFASAGLGISLAVQGSLSNFAGGVLIILTRPFRIGDYIEVDSYSGTVEDIKLIYTTLATSDNKVINIPNRSLANSTITNYSMKDTRRLDLEFSISYKDNIEKAKKIITQCIIESNLSLPDKNIFVNVIRHNASSVDIVARIWVKNDDYWNLKFILLESVKKAFDKNNITIPFPQLTVTKDK